MDTFTPRLRPRSSRAYFEPFDIAQDRLVEKEVEGRTGTTLGANGIFEIADRLWRKRGWNPQQRMLTGGGSVMRTFLRVFAMALALASIGRSPPMCF
ncbi:MAG: hypothetical protein A3G24_11055 [Betaproteobacteria bacterium RIFCSPLOWO2_12_FULL_62_13]|nr:MAG: hypothetical protein A3G24_11055 [Betaproteobacteria bacterium RIFCSPLOWO2_12_FULL_62_13]